jgi:hypothetical protein
MQIPCEHPFFPQYSYLLLLISTLGSSVHEPCALFDLTRKLDFMTCL